jgi:hypothetical protein
MRGVTIGACRTTRTDPALLVWYRIVDRFSTGHGLGLLQYRSESCWERNSRDWQVHAIVVVHQGDTYPQYSNQSHRDDRDEALASRNCRQAAPGR